MASGMPKHVFETKKCCVVLQNINLLRKWFVLKPVYSNKLLKANQCLCDVCLKARQSTVLTMGKLFITGFAA